MKYIIKLIIGALVLLGVWFILPNEDTTENKANNIDLPEEFNEYTISKDKNNPTELIAVYDTTMKKFIMGFKNK